MKLMQRWSVGVVALVGGVMAFAPVAGADEAMWRNFRGQVVFSDVALAPAANFENAALMTSALRRIQRSTIDQREGFWRLHVLAFLDRPAESGTLRLRATDVSDPGKPRQVRVFDVPVERGERELRLNDFVVTPAMGFAAGGSYELALEAAPRDEGPGASAEGGEARKAGKADVYAKGVITLR